METSALRFGNVVFDQYHNFEEVMSLDGFSNPQKINGFDADDYKPVKISTEILRMFGFVCISSSFKEIWQHAVTDFKVMPSDSSSGFWCIAMMDDSGMSHRPYFQPFQYFHELQNLHRFVKGKDFEIKL